MSLGWGEQTRSCVRVLGTGGGDGENGTKETKEISFGVAFLFGRVLWDGSGELEPHLTPPLPCEGLLGRSGGGEENRLANNITRTLRVSVARAQLGQSHSCLR